MVIAEYVQVVLQCVAKSDKAETKSKSVDIMYSGRGMPFRVVVSSLCEWGRGVGEVPYLLVHRMMHEMPERVDTIL